MIYQEQLLDIVRKFGGRSYGGADLFRKAIGKKNEELVKQEATKLYQEIIDNGYDEQIARTISDDLKTKGGYLFNKSHSYAYAVLCLQTAYLKSHYTIYFFKSLLNMNVNKAGMINKYILDANKFNIEISKPHINRSDKFFSIYNSSILFGIGAITGIGDKLTDEIIEERNVNGFYKNIDNLKKRVKITTAQMVFLIKSGAIPSKNKKGCLIDYLKSCFQMDEFKYKPVTSYKTKKEMIEIWGINVDDYKVDNKVDKDAVLAVYNNVREKKMREDFYIKRNTAYHKYVDDCNEKYLKDEPFWEFQALQIFLNGNPFEEAYQYFTRTFNDVENDEDCVVVGVIAKIQKKKNKYKQQFAFVNIYSSFGLIEALVFPTQYKQFEEFIRKGNQIAMRGTKESETQILCESIRSYESWLEYAKNRAKKSKVG